MKKEILKLRGVKVHFPVQAGVFNRVVGHVLAVDGVDSVSYTHLTLPTILLV